MNCTDQVLWVKANLARQVRPIERRAAGKFLRDPCDRVSDGQSPELDLIFGAAKVFVRPASPTRSISGGALDRLNG
jgi:hypothetical protein